MESGVTFLLLSLLLVSSLLSDAADQNTVNTGKKKSLLSCLRRYSIPTEIIFTPGNGNYTTVLFSSFQNARILVNSPEPAVIITPTKESHVQASVLCSLELNIPIRTRSRGHDYEGLSYTSILTSFFIVIDLQNLRSITIDVAQGTAWVQSGATIGELYYAIAMESRAVAFPAGSCPSLGVGGHFSGGGMGNLMRSHGLSIDHIIDAVIVTAKGEILDRASMGEDLFWALRGGGGASFGVILSYKIELVEVPPTVTVFTRSTAGIGAIDLVSKWQQTAYKLDGRVFMDAILSPSQVNDQNRTVQVTFSSVFLGEKKELLVIMGESYPELKLNETDCIEMSWIESVLYVVGYSPNTALSVLLDRSPPSRSNFSFKNKSDFLTTPISKESWEEIFRRMLEGNELSYLIIEALGGRMHDIPATETPYPHRKGSLYDIQYVVQWTETRNETADQKHLESMRRFYNFMTPYVSSNPRAAYLNYRDLDLGMNGEGNTSYVKASRWGSRYFMGNFRRLAQVKTMVDPSNYFTNEQSIPLL